MGRQATPTRDLCPFFWTDRGCSGSGHNGGFPHPQCPHIHRPYPSAFMQALDQSPSAWQHLPAESDAFRPLLGVESASPSLSPSSSPSNSSPVVWLVALPIPCQSVWTGAVIGRGGAHIHSLRHLTGLQGKEQLRFDQTAVREDSRWLYMRGRGEAWQVDCLIEALFLLTTNPSLTWSSEDCEQRLTQHIEGFLNRRGKQSPELQSLLSLHARGVPASPPPSTVMVCMAQLDRRRCPSPTCPYSHLPYARLFAELCDTRVIALASIPDITPLFHPILAPSPTLSPRPARYVVSLPIPRIPFLLSFIIGSRGSTIRCLLQGTGLQSIVFWPKRCQPFELGDEPVDWLTLRAEGQRPQVDSLMEGVFWLLDKGRHLMDEQTRVDALRQHLQSFHHRSAHDQPHTFHSLTSRGVSSPSAAPHLTPQPTPHLTPQPTPHPTPHPAPAQRRSATSTPHPRPPRQWSAHSGTESKEPHTDRTFLPLFSSSSARSAASSQSWRGAERKSEEPVQPRWQRRRWRGDEDDDDHD